MPEYAVLLALITVFCITALTFFGQDLSDFLLGFATEIQNVETSPPPN